MSFNKNLVSFTWWKE